MKTLPLTNIVACISALIITFSLSSLINIIITDNQIQRLMQNYTISENARKKINAYIKEYINSEYIKSCIKRNLENSCGLWQAQLSTKTQDKQFLFIAGNKSCGINDNEIISYKICDFDITSNSKEFINHIIKDNLRIEAPKYLEVKDKTGKVYTTKDY